MDIDDNFISLLSKFNWNDGCNILYMARHG